MQNQPLDLQGHFILTSANEVHQICKPLFNSFQTTYFNFVRRYRNGTEACLTTNPEWTEYFYTQKLYKLVLADKFARAKTLVNKLKIIPWSQFSNSPVRLAQSEMFGVGIGISLIFTRCGHTDFFHFGTENKNQHMNELYINYADCLVQFAYYFYDKANKLITQATQNKNRLFLADRPLSNIDEDFPSLPNFNVNEFIAATHPQHFVLYHRSGEVILTKKEIMCINLAAQGQTASEIGKVLFISKRTVETHLKNARLKLGLDTGATKADIIAELYKSDFDLHDLLPAN